MGVSDELDEARAAFDKGAWADACARLRGLDAQVPLDPDDLDRLATAAYLVGDDAASVNARARAHARFLERDEPVRAARSAYWLAFTLVDRPGQQSTAAGWLARAQRLIDEAGEPCVEEGWLLCASGRQSAAHGDFASAHARFCRPPRSAPGSATPTSWCWRATARAAACWAWAGRARGWCSSTR